MTLVRTLVEHHGGTVALPKATAKAAAANSSFAYHSPHQPPVTVPPPEAKQVLNVSQPSIKVAIVEDNDDSRMMLCELLELSGFECHTAATGPLGLELVTELQPDVALIDIGLPGLDGLEVARLLRRDPRNAELVLVALTGYGQKDDRDAALQAGFDTHLVKPVDFDALLQLLRSQPPKQPRSPVALADTLPAT